MSTKFTQVTNCLCLMEMYIISSKMHPSFQGSGEGFRGALGASSWNVGQGLRTEKESEHIIFTHLTNSQDPSLPGTGKDGTVLHYL